jgi:hypothetical protein
MALQIDSIKYLFGKDYRDEPEIRRALEIADRRFREIHSTELDNTSTHRDFLKKTAAQLLTSEGASLEIQKDVAARGMYRNSRYGGGPNAIGFVGTDPYRHADRGSGQGSGGRSFENGDGSVTIVFAEGDDPAKGPPMASSAYNDPSGFNRRDAAMPGLVGTDRFGRDSRGYYQGLGAAGAPPAERDRLEREDRMAQRRNNSDGGYIHGARTTASTGIRYIDGVQHGSKVYGDPKTFPKREPWRSER